MARRHESNLSALFIHISKVSLGIASIPSDTLKYCLFTDIQACLAFNWRNQKKDKKSNADHWGTCKYFLKKRVLHEISPKIMLSFPLKM